MGNVADIGVIHGRFQPVHMGHMEYLLEGKKRCKFLFVGISIPDPRYAPEAENSHRGPESSNPFTYRERLFMLRDSLLAAGVKREQFEIVPFPVDNPEYLKYYVPLDGLFFVTIYDEWGKKKARLFESMGLAVDIMWEREMKDRLTTGTEVRKNIGEGKPWGHLVPEPAREYILKNGLGERIGKS